jgi:hypothetical protein
MALDWFPGRRILQLSGEGGGFFSGSLCRHRAVDVVGWVGGVCTAGEWVNAWRASERSRRMENGGWRMENLGDGGIGEFLSAAEKLGPGRQARREEGRAVGELMRQSR